MVVSKCSDCIVVMESSGGDGEQQLWGSGGKVLGGSG